MQKLLLVIDMQNEFVTGVLGTPEAIDVIEKIRQKAKRHQEEGNPVIFTMDTHQEEDYASAEKTQEAALLPKHCIQGSDGWQIVPELRPFAGEANTLHKPTFLSPTLATFIRDRYGDEVEIEICGVCTDICVVSNALALRADFPAGRIAVDGACCAGTTTENHRAALAVMKSCLVEVL